MRLLRTGCFASTLGGLMLVLLPPCRAQTAEELRTRLHSVAAANSLISGDMRPWHLKLSVTVHHGKEADETGTVEEWWSGAKAHRITYDLPPYHATAVVTADGYFQTPDTGGPPPVLSTLLEQITDPIADTSEIDDSTPELRKQSFGKTDLDCIMLDQPIPGQSGFLPLGLFPTYCVEPKGDALRVSYLYGAETFVRERMGRFRERQVALDVSLTANNVLAAQAHVDMLQGQEEPYAASISTDGLVERKTSGLARISAGVLNSSKLTSRSPVYPASARERHVSGTVLLHAIIGEDGLIRSLKVVSSPDPDLTIAAIEAVRAWTYRPYTLNGVPVSVETQITVNFNLSP